MVVLEPESSSHHLMISVLAKPGIGFQRPVAHP